MMAELIVLRLVHILGGMIWVGTGIFNTFFLLPALGQAVVLNPAPIPLEPDRPGDLV